MYGARPPDRLRAAHEIDLLHSSSKQPVLRACLALILAPCNFLGDRWAAGRGHPTGLRGGQWCSRTTLDGPEPRRQELRLGDRPATRANSVVASPHRSRLLLSRRGLRETSVSMARFAHSQRT